MTPKGNGGIGKPTKVTKPRICKTTMLHITVGPGVTKQPDNLFLEEKKNPNLSN